MPLHDDPRPETTNSDAASIGRLGVETRLLLSVFQRDNAGRYGRLDFSPLNRWAVRRR